MSKNYVLALLLAAACTCTAINCAAVSKEEQTGSTEESQERTGQWAETGSEELEGTADTSKEQSASAAWRVWLLSEAVYPEMAAYPDEMSYLDGETGEYDDQAFSEAYDAWWADRYAQRDQPEGYADGLEDFFAHSIREFLSGAGEENLVYSPLNVYLALGMLAETADGESRAQILELLGAESIEALRAQAASVWNANYCDDGAVTCLLASSLWLDGGFEMNAKTLEILAENYYASSFQGEMGSGAYNSALQGWLNEQTGGLLEEQADGVEMDAGTVLALATTIYYRAKWMSEFTEAATESGTFHAAAGDEACDFMHQSGSATYFWGEHFSAVAQSLAESGNMWFLLPDEGYTPEDLLADDEAMSFLLSGGVWENQKYLIVNKTIPKFDVSSGLDLAEGLKNLGVTDIFDSGTADFSPLAEDSEGIAVSGVSHAARVAIDEEGVVATAFTLMMYAGAGMPPDEEVDFVLDRPFLFCITGTDGLPLFAGVVNSVGL